MSCYLQSLRSDPGLKPARGLLLYIWTGLYFTWNDDRIVSITLHLTAVVSFKDEPLAPYLLISVVTSHHDSYLICSSVPRSCHNGSLSCIFFFPQHHHSQMSVQEGVNSNLEAVALMQREPQSFLLSGQVTITGLRHSVLALQSLSNGYWMLDECYHLIKVTASFSRSFVACGGCFRECVTFGEIKRDVYLDETYHIGR